MHRRRKQGERDVGPPHPIVRAGCGERLAAEVGAEETADLVREHDDAEQRRHVARSVELRDQASRRRHRREPGEPEPGGEQDKRDLGLRRREEREDRDRAPTAGGSWQESTTPGMWVEMNATWKPQVKKPELSSR